MRKTLTILMIVLGIALSGVSYFIWAAPISSSPMTAVSSDPRVPYAPTFFIVGIVLVFLAAVVYELLPDREGS
jgi:hypothetical protein